MSKMKKMNCPECGEELVYLNKYKKRTNFWCRNCASSITIEDHSKIVKLLLGKNPKVYIHKYTSNSNAEELFEKLGFTKSYDNEYTLKYTSEVTPIDVEFFKESKLIVLSDRIDGYETTIKASLIDAIAQQLDELYLNEIGDNDE